MSNGFFEYLAKVDATLLSSGRPVIPPAERQSILITGQVNPEEGRGFDWLVPEAHSKAKFIHAEGGGGFACFIFDDRSILILLQSGHVYALPSATDSNIKKIEAWLLSHHIEAKP
ncbi:MULTISPECIES: hypothetical protein [Pseudomonas]|uniref:hypothetical protein n=1 Tax=Pseudomonas TaxID=286 RepID=UPI0018E7A05E|nr:MULTISPECIES: hypothetical protein [Pseudomonas]MBJ2214051.1 hypothetical protein [Pseudomonas carnis]MBP5947919.1 hypothetical protein [Pseudomonas sp. P9(2020)]